MAEPKASITPVRNEMAKPEMVKTDTAVDTKEKIYTDIEMGLVVRKMIESKVKKVTHFDTEM